MQKKIVRIGTDVLLILVGSTLLAVSYNLFLIPHQIVPGGVGGASMILNHFFKTPVGLMTIVLNIPLFAIGIRVLGKSYGIKSIIGMLVSSLMIDFFTYLVPLPCATDNPVLASIFGGLTLGVGLGLVFRSGGSTGGSDIVGQVLHRFTNLSTGSAILVVDFVVISLAGWAFGDFELALFGYLNLYLTTRVLDMVLEGASYTRAMFIISEKSSEIGKAIVKEVHRGATLLHGAGAYTDADREVVLSVLSKKEVPRVREFVRSIDPHAFVIITDVYEVLGEGFRRRGPESSEE
jgi:uncharacterized membrane-anchored protein YitT (DUF2179 family)